MSSPIGKDTKNLSVNMPNVMYDNLMYLAGRSRLRIGQYVRLILQEAIRQKAVVKIDTPVRLSTNKPKARTGRRL